MDATGKNASFARDLAVALAVLAVSSAAAATANALRSRPLPWIREALPAIDGADATSADGAATSDARPASKAQVAMDEVLSLLASGEAAFIDAREDGEYAAGHLRGAYNLPSTAIYAKAEQILGMVSIEQRVIVYCDGGQCEASKNVRDALIREFGYKDVAIYTKGWEEVTQSGRFADLIVAGDQP